MQIYFVKNARLISAYIVTLTGTPSRNLFTVAMSRCGDRDDSVLILDASLTINQKIVTFKYAKSAKKSIAIYVAMFMVQELKSVQIPFARIPYEPTNSCTPFLNSL